MAYLNRLLVLITLFIVCVKAKECCDQSKNCSKYAHHCRRESISKRCRKTCGLCTPSTTLPPATIQSTLPPSTTTTGRVVTSYQTKKTSKMTTMTGSTTTEQPKSTQTSLGITRAIQRECTTIHTNFRTLHKDTKPLEWDRQLQVEAQKWANHLIDTNSFIHSTNRGNVGENIFQYEGYDDNIAGKCALAVYIWYTQSVYYDIKTHTSTKNTDDFTQMVWKNTKRVGFGIAQKGRRFVVVAQYFPRGNIDGLFEKNVMPPRFTGVILER